MFYIQVVWKHTDSAPLNLLVRRYKITLLLLKSTLRQKKSLEDNIVFALKMKSATRNLFNSQIWRLMGKISSE